MRKRLKGREILRETQRKSNFGVKITLKEKGLKIWSELIRLTTKTNDQSLSTRQFTLYRTAEEFHREMSHL
jgi:hypothetical protein